MQRYLIVHSEDNTLDNSFSMLLGKLFKWYALFACSSDIVCFHSLILELNKK